MKLPTPVLVRCEDFKTVVLPPTHILDPRWPHIEQFLNGSEISPGSRRTYEFALRRFLSWTNKPWGNIQFGDIILYKRFLNDGELAPATVNLSLNALRTFYNWFGKTNLFQDDRHPLTGIQLNRLDEPPAKDLTPTELQRIWSTVNDQPQTRQRDVILLWIFGLGLRSKEICNLNVGSRTQDHDRESIFLITNTKTKKPRMVPILPQLDRLLDNYLTERQTQGEKISGDSPLIISHHRGFLGQRLTYQGLYGIVKAIGEQAEVESLHPHRFRHTAAVDFLRKQIDPHHVKLLLGHNSERVFSRYTRSIEQEAAVKASRAALTS
jgi:integrase/recombinase XerD